MDVIIFLYTKLGYGNYSSAGFTGERDHFLEGLNLQLAILELNFCCFASIVFYLDKNCLWNLEALWNKNYLWNLGVLRIYRGTTEE